MKARCITSLNTRRKQLPSSPCTRRQKTKNKELVAEHCILYKARSSILGGDRHMPSRTFLYEIQWQTTFIWMFFWCDAYFWQRWTSNWIYFPIFMIWATWRFCQCIQEQLCNQQPCLNNMRCIGSYAISLYNECFWENTPTSYESKF